MLVSTAAVVAVATAVVGMRLANPGSEPVDENWWLVAELVVGLTYLPTGAVLIARTERRLLGALFVVVAVAALVDAPATQYLAYAQDHPGEVASPWFASLSDWAWVVGSAVLAGPVLVALVPVTGR